MTILHQNCLQFSNFWASFFLLNFPPLFRANVFSKTKVPHGYNHNILTNVVITPVCYNNPRSSNINSTTGVKCKNNKNSNTTWPNNSHLHPHHQTSLIHTINIYPIHIYSKNIILFLANTFFFRNSSWFTALSSIINTKRIGTTLPWSPQQLLPPQQLLSSRTNNYRSASRGCITLYNLIIFWTIYQRDFYYILFSYLYLHPVCVITCYQSTITVFLMKYTPSTTTEQPWAVCKPGSPTWELSQLSSTDASTVALYQLSWVGASSAGLVLAQLGWC